MSVVQFNAFIVNNFNFEKVKQVTEVDKWVLAEVVRK